MKIRAKKLERLQNVTSPKGTIAAAAMDQRGSLQKSIAQARGIKPGEVTAADMAAFKIAVTKVLTPYASAVLLDPEYGLEAAGQRAGNAGLLLAYEQTGYDNTQPGKIPLLLKNWSVKQAVAAGADCIKLLIYYHPDENPKVNEQKHVFTQKVGEECDAHDMPFFLEFVGYGLKDEDPKTDLAYAKKKPEIVARSMEEFSKEKYKVTVLKVEIPVNMKCVAGAKTFAGEQAYSQAEAMAHYRAAASATNLPFIYLSAGVSDEEFRESLALAGEAGVSYNGVLCGRATWKEGIPVFAKEGPKALERWLSDRGVQNIQAMNVILDKTAKPWAGLYSV